MIQTTFPLLTGAVTDDCACEVDAPGGSNESMPITTSIPLDPTCYSPDGTQCSWYRNCLEVSAHFPLFIVIRVPVLFTQNPKHTCNEDSRNNFPFIAYCK